MAKSAITKFPEGGKKTDLLKPSGRVTVLSRELSSSDASSVVKDDLGSNQLNDPWEESYRFEADASFSALRPPMKMETLKSLPMRNAILLQCVHAMVTNCFAFGHTVVYIGEEGEKDSELSKQEKLRIENFLDFPNESDSLSSILGKTGNDYETLGNVYWEIGRNGAGDIDFFYHIPAERMRICKIDSEAVEVSIRLPRNGAVVEMKARRFFRRYVQMIGAKKVYFKEFGDPRIIDPKSGKVTPSLPLEEQATEVLHIPQYFAGSPYGMPCWANNLPAIIGMREADMVNLQYFEDNAIPAMAIMVSGGSLSNDTMLELQEKFVNNRGRDQVNRVVIIEAVADMDAAGNTEAAPPVPQLSIQPLRDAQQSDALFLAYDEACMSKIRGSFRLPPMYCGRSDDYNRATAETSSQLAETQVFAPRRLIFDDVINKKLLVAGNEPPKFWNYRSNASRLVDPALILQALTVLEAVGAATPNLAIQIANDLFGLDLPAIVDDWGTKPFEFTKQKLAADTAAAAVEQKTALNLPVPPKPGDKSGFPKGGFPIKKEDMDTLTRATMALSTYITKRDAEEEVAAKAKAGKKAAKPTRLRE